MNDASIDAVAGPPVENAYRTAGGIAVRRTRRPLPYQGAIEPLVAALDQQIGVLLSSSFEYPGRYTRWDIGFCDPPLSLTSRGRNFTIAASNARGRVLIPAIAAALNSEPAIERFAADDGSVRGTVRKPAGRFTEEERSKQPSIFSVLRALIALFKSDADPQLGLYGAFGYDLAFQFEPIPKKLPRAADQRDLVLFVPDRLVIVDHKREEAWVCDYEFAVGNGDTSGLPREGSRTPVQRGADIASGCDHAPGEYAANVTVAKAAFERGDLFEVVPGQMFLEPCAAPPSAIFRTLRERNPAPYGFFMNLGDGEHLVGASPEMYVRVTGDRVETCPISGTIARGVDPVGDAEQILRLLNSEKDAAELTMCTDVDRNDKSRICEPGSVAVIGRRQIELYSRLIHTVDHVEGRLRAGFDALDAFLSHAWAVTVTGAPKTHAMRFIERHEKSPRRWYGGAVGLLNFSGDMNTGLTLRTVRIKDGVAEVRAGATLLYDSDPDAEEAETRLKASAMLDAIRSAGRPAAARKSAAETAMRSGVGKRVLLIDHEDSFVHTLANYFRQTGATVTTWRAGFDPAALAAEKPDLLVLSPGPGRPEDFGISKTLGAAHDLNLPVFGVCLGLQGMAEYCGAKLALMPIPQHGKSATVRVQGGKLFDALPPQFKVGRYHSIHVPRDTIPDALTVTAETEDGIVMAVEHRDLPWAGVQFHPESIMTLDDGAGQRIIDTVMRVLAK